MSRQSPQTEQPCPWSCLLASQRSPGLSPNALKARAGQAKARLARSKARPPTGTLGSEQDRPGGCHPNPLQWPQQASQPTKLHSTAARPLPGTMGNGEESPLPITPHWAPVSCLLPATGHSSLLTRAVLPDKGLALPSFSKGRTQVNLHQERQEPGVTCQTLGLMMLTRQKVWAQHLF